MLGASFGSHHLDAHLGRGQPAVLLADFGAGALLAALALTTFATFLGFLAGARALPLQALVAKRALWAAAGAVVVAVVPIVRNARRKQPPTDMTRRMPMATSPARRMSTATSPKRHRNPQ